MGEAEDRLVELAGRIHVEAYHRRNKMGKDISVSQYFRSPGKMSLVEIHAELKHLASDVKTPIAQKENRTQQLTTELRKRGSAPRSPLDSPADAVGLKPKSDAEIHTGVQSEVYGKLFPSMKDRIGKLDSKAPKGGARKAKGGKAKVAPAPKSTSAIDALKAQVSGLPQGAGREPRSRDRRGGSEASEVASVARSNKAAESLMDLIHERRLLGLPELKTQLDSKAPKGGARKVKGGKSKAAPKSTSAIDALKEQVGALPQGAGREPRSRDRRGSGEASEVASVARSNKAAEALVDLIHERRLLGLPELKTQLDSGAKPVSTAALAKAHKTAGKGTGTGKGTVDDPINVAGNVELAAKLLADGKHIRLNKVDEVGTLLDKLKAMVDEANAKGEKAPTFDLCKVSVPKTNLFCAQSKGIPRAKMPQFGGQPRAGSAADKLPRDKKGEVSTEDAFRAKLKELGIGVQLKTVKAESLKASQMELDGPKVAGMSKAMAAGKVPDAPIFVTKDGYIIDGHHRWASKVALDAQDGHMGDISMPVEQVDMEIGEALDFANAFTNEIGILPKGLGAAAEGVKPDVSKKSLDQLTLGDIPDQPGGIPTGPPPSGPAPKPVSLPGRYTPKLVDGAWHLFDKKTGTSIKKPSKPGSSGFAAAKAEADRLNAGDAGLKSGAHEGPHGPASGKGGSHKKPGIFDEHQLSPAAEAKFKRDVNFDNSARILRDRLTGLRSGAHLNSEVPKAERLLDQTLPGRNAKPPTKGAKHKKPGGFFSSRSGFNKDAVKRGVDGNRPKDQRMYSAPKGYKAPPGALLPDTPEQRAKNAADQAAVMAKAAERAKARNSPSPNGRGLKSEASTSATPPKTIYDMLPPEGKSAKGIRGFFGGLASKAPMRPGEGEAAIAKEKRNGLKSLTDREVASALLAHSTPEMRGEQFRRKTQSEFNRFHEEAQRRQAQQSRVDSLKKQVAGLPHKGLSSEASSGPGKYAPKLIDGKWHVVNKSTGKSVRQAGDPTFGAPGAPAGEEAAKALAARMEASDKNRAHARQFYSKSQGLRSGAPKPEAAHGIPSGATPAAQGKPAGPEGLPSLFRPEHKMRKEWPFKSQESKWKEERAAQDAEWQKKDAKYQEEQKKRDLADQTKALEYIDEVNVPGRKDPKAMSLDEVQSELSFVNSVTDNYDNEGDPPVIPYDQQDALLKSPRIKALQARQAQLGKALLRKFKKDPTKLSTNELYVVQHVASDGEKRSVKDELNRRDGRPTEDAQSQIAKLQAQVEALKQGRTDAPRSMSHRRTSNYNEGDYMGVSTAPGDQPGYYGTVDQAKVSDVLTMADGGKSKKLDKHLKALSDNDLSGVDAQLTATYSERNSAASAVARLAVRTELRRRGLVSGGLASKAPAQAVERLKRASRLKAQSQVSDKAMKKRLA